MSLTIARPLRGFGSRILMGMLLGATLSGTGPRLSEAGVMASPPSEPISARFTLPSAGGRDQTTMSVGDCIPLKFEVKFKGTNNYVDVSQSTSFFLDPPTSGQFNAGPPPQFCAEQAGAYPVHGRYTDAKTGISVTAGVHVVVRKRTVTCH